MRQKLTRCRAITKSIAPTETIVRLRSRRREAETVGAIVASLEATTGLCYTCCAAARTILTDAGGACIATRAVIRRIGEKVCSASWRR